MPPLVGGGKEWVSPIGAVFLRLDHYISSTCSSAQGSGKRKEREMETNDGVWREEEGQDIKRIHCQERERERERERVLIR